MKKETLLPAISLFFSLSLFGQKTELREKGDIAVISNGIVSFSFNKTNADLSAIVTANKVSLLGKNGRAYLLGPAFNMSPSRFSVIRNTDSLIELSFYHEASNHFQYDLHYILKSGDPGIYCYLQQSHKAGDSTGDYEQTRWGLRADESLFDYHLVRDSIQGPMPKMEELTDEVQDWTYRMPDSSYYTKYDYADYIEDRFVHGMAGQKSGLGLFVIQASHEYLNGGPTKQYQNVHANPYLINMFNCGHFLSDVRKGDNKIDDTWTKISGPFFLYVATGNSVADIWSKAKEKTEEEKGKWPYSWMQNENYPLIRGTVSGRLTVNNKAATAGTHIILADSKYDWQAQSRGYIYYTTTEEGGLFTIPQVRPGQYTLYAYGSNQTEEFVKTNVAVKPDVVTLLTKLNWQPATHGERLWQIGVADRKTTGFKLADQKRNYAVFLQPSADLSFTIGKSHEASDWYYTQTKQGKWDILFTTTKEFTDTTTLTVAVAGCARNPTLDIVVNGTVISTLQMGNDASVYRSAIAGGYYQLKKIRFPSNLLKKGANKISLHMRVARHGAGIMYDAIKLEAK
jgi:rhamnogalacturonan endolyase